MRPDLCSDVVPLNVIQLQIPSCISTWPVCLLLRDEVIENYLTTHTQLKLAKTLHTFTHPSLP